MAPAPADRDLARTVARACYGREPPVEPVPGCNNPVFRLKFPDGTRVLKFGPAVRKEAGVLRLVAGRGVPAPAVEHADPDGRSVGRPFLILAGAGERTVLDCLAACDPNTPALFEQMGVALARTHAIEATGLPTRDPGPLWQRLHAAAYAAVRAGAVRAEDVARFQALPVPDPGGAALCHGDYHAVQCVERAGRLTGVVDWEEAWVGNPTVDLAVAHAYFDYYAPPDLTRRFLAAYAAVRPLPGDYEVMSRPVRMAHALSLWHVWHTRDRAADARRAADLFRSYARA